MSSPQQNQIRGQNRFCLEVGWEEERGDSTNNEYICKDM
jgi:hypothetical protein